MATLSSLLSGGYFPRELPPPFTTASYARYAKKHGSSWDASGWTRCVAHNLARPGGLRRPLKIPNPVSYFALAEIISGNWALINQHTWAHRLSASRPFLLKSSGRAVVPRVPPRSERDGPTAVLRTRQEEPSCRSRSEPVVSSPPSRRPMFFGAT